MPGACSALATGRPGIAVLPGMAQIKKIKYERVKKQNPSWRSWLIEVCMNVDNRGGLTQTQPKLLTYGFEVSLICPTRIYTVLQENVNRNTKP